MNFFFEIFNKILGKAKELFYIYLVFLIVQTTNLLLFGDIRFSVGLPNDHWGILFVKEFPTGFWYFLRNGWVFYAMFFIFYWFKIRSIIVCLIAFVPIFIIVAIFDFCFVSKNSGMYFRFDLIGLSISIFVIFLIEIICLVLKKLYRILN